NHKPPQRLTALSPEAGIGTAGVPRAGCQEDPYPKRLGTLALPPSVFAIFSQLPSQEGNPLGILCSPIAPEEGAWSSASTHFAPLSDCPMFVHAKMERSQSSRLLSALR